MEYQGRLYFIPKKEIKKRSDELLEFAGLGDYHRRVVRHLSGGMKRKLMICRALLIEPEILLLDEPTAGMDALSRRQMWNLLRQVSGQNMTILLTTHYIEEAEALCDRVAMINRGRLQKLDSPRALIQELGEFTVDETGEGELKSTHFTTREEAIRYLETAPADSTLRQTTLEDVFVDVAGRKLI
jgi:ABC-2 type transport system ATP-binding protein